MIAASYVASEEAGNTDTDQPSDVSGEKHSDVSKEQYEYAKGSVCGYCTYCKVNNYLD